MYLCLFSIKTSIEERRVYPMYLTWYYHLVKVLYCTFMTRYWYWYQWKLVLKRGVFTPCICAWASYSMTSMSSSSIMPYWYWPSSTRADEYSCWRCSSSWLVGTMGAVGGASSGGSGTQRATTSRTWLPDWRSTDATCSEPMPRTLTSPIWRTWSPLRSLPSWKHNGECYHNILKTLYHLQVYTVCHPENTTENAITTYCWKLYTIYRCTQSAILKTQRRMLSQHTENSIPSTGVHSWDREHGHRCEVCHPENTTENAITTYYWKLYTIYRCTQLRYIEGWC